MYGDDWDYAGSRLNGSIVAKGKDPMLIMEVGRMGVVGHNLRTGDAENCKLSDLDVKPFKLGYLNFRGGVGYLARIPKRQDWRQGLRRGNCSFTHMTVDTRFDPSSREFCLSLSKTVSLEYPSYEASYKKAINRGVAVAFHRHWAISSDGNLLYKNGETVGVCAEGGPVLDKKYGHLKEYLEECK